MHEMSLLNDLMAKIDVIATREKASKVSQVTLWLGALAHISADHLREHFDYAARQTVAAGSTLQIEVSEDEKDPNAQAILLRSVEIETD